MKSTNKVSFILLALVIAISSIIGYNSLYPSKVNYDDYTKVNTKNQMEHIKEIAKEPHSIFDDKAHDDVRDYIIKELEKLGLEPKTYKYEDLYVERTNTKEDIENIYAQIDGKNDSYIMLVTHYDSSKAKTERYAEVDGSVGAADAGYALSTIFETIRVIKENNIEMNNGIKILITDAEEYGLLGAKEAVGEEEIFENVNYLINLEARGTKGPAIMFETSTNNSSVVDLYSKSEKPFSYSITPEIYRLLPNATDFSVFLENDIPGINISVLDGLENYHTPNDSIESLNEKSMQHYGDQVLPIVTEFVSNETYASDEAVVSDNDSIFFIIGNVFVKYSKIVNYVLLGMVVACILVLYKKFKISNILSVLKYTFINIGYILFISGISYGVSRLAAIVNKRPFKLTYLPLIKYEYLIILLVIAVATIGYVLLIKKISNEYKEKNEHLLGSIILLFVLGLVLTVFLPGGSYLFVVPALLLGVFNIVVSMFRDSINKIGYVLLIPIAMVVILYVPTVYLFNCALTFGALCATMIFAMIAIISVIACSLQINTEEKKFKVRY